ncbi:RnfABCDGE type electron transport complex subunit D, partial [Planctomycetota bacterium]
RALALLLSVCIAAVLTEGAFTWKKGKPVTAAVLVTAVLFTLSLPPTIPIWMALVGIVFAVVFAKMAFGGMGMNVFNPAVTGRCFVYITFPIAMTATWVLPANGGAFPGALSAWGLDAVSMATPLDAFKAGGPSSIMGMFLGNTSGCLGETSALLIIIGGLYLLWRKAASWQIMASCSAGMIIASLILHSIDSTAVALPLYQALAGGFMFGTVFMATDPITAAKTPLGKWIYGTLIGFLIVVFRGYSNFSCGVMFAILIGNMFAPLIDIGVKSWKARQKARSAATENT